MASINPALPPTNVESKSTSLATNHERSADQISPLGLLLRLSSRHERRIHERDRCDQTYRDLNPAKQRNSRASLVLGSLVFLGQLQLLSTRLDDDLPRFPL